MSEIGEWKRDALEEFSGGCIPNLSTLVLAHCGLSF